MTPRQWGGASGCLVLLSPSVLCTMWHHTFLIVLAIRPGRIWVPRAEGGANLSLKLRSVQTADAHGIHVSLPLISWELRHSAHRVKVHYYGWNVGDRTMTFFLSERSRDKWKRLGEGWPHVPLGNALRKYKIYQGDILSTCDVSLARLWGRDWPSLLFIAEDSHYAGYRSLKYQESRSVGWCV